MNNNDKYKYFNDELKNISNKCKKLYFLYVNEHKF